MVLPMKLTFLFLLFVSAVSGGKKIKKCKKNNKKRCLIIEKLEFDALKDDNMFKVKYKLDKNYKEGSMVAIVKHGKDHTIENHIASEEMATKMKGKVFFRLSSLPKKFDIYLHYNGEAVNVPSILLDVKVKSRGDVLTFPPTIDSENGLLSTTLTHGYTDWDGPNDSIKNARIINGIIPGPTLRLEAGDKLKILLKNEMQPETFTNPAPNTNKYQDHTNIHFHGPHVSGNLPSDDIRMHISPGKEYQYETDFPDDHLPGTHWAHPHVHGATELHLSNGAAMALIVKDPPDYLPDQIKDAEDILLVMQDFHLKRTKNAADAAGDTRFSYTRVKKLKRYWLVNGQLKPFLQTKANEWQRWRVLYAGHNVQPMDLRVEGCETVLLAKDGIYVQDFPRPVDIFPIPVGGRADLMVRCSKEGQFPVYDFKDDVMMTILVSGEDSSATDLSAWKPDYPEYLNNLQATSTDSGCKCETNMGACLPEMANFVGCINNFAYDPERYVHSIELGKVVERLVNPANHSYHQHVYPFQFVGYTETEYAVTDYTKHYFQEGDWNDVMQMIGLTGKLKLRFHPRTHLGLVMIHCHRLSHEDHGMMGWEYIFDKGGCECDAKKALD